MARVPIIFGIIFCCFTYINAGEGNLNGHFFVQDGIEHDFTSDSTELHLHNNVGEGIYKVVSKQGHFEVLYDGMVISKLPKRSRYALSIVNGDLHVAVFKGSAKDATSHSMKIFKKETFHQFDSF